MVRTARFDARQFVDAAIELVSEGGAGAASMSAIARKVGAPNGSVYHRFESRSAVIGEAWLDVYQSFVSTLEPRLREGNIQSSALAIVDWAERDVSRARFLFLNELEDLLDGAMPERLRLSIRQQEDSIDGAFRSCLVTNGIVNPSEECVTRIKFAIFDGPIAIIKPYLLSHSILPTFVRKMVQEIGAYTLETYLSDNPVGEAAQ